MRNIPKYMPIKKLKIIIEIIFTLKISIKIQNTFYYNL